MTVWLIEEIHHSVDEFTPPNPRAALKLKASSPNKSLIWVSMPCLEWQAILWLKNYFVFTKTLNSEKFLCFCPAAEQTRISRKAVISEANENLIRIGPTKTSITLHIGHSYHSEFKCLIFCKTQKLFFKNRPNNRSFCFLNVQSELRGKHTVLDIRTFCDIRKLTDTDEEPQVGGRTLVPIIFKTGSIFPDCNQKA